MTQAINLNPHAKAVISRMEELGWEEKRRVALCIDNYSVPRFADSPHPFTFIAKTVHYIAFRFFNALKACFGLSDWQQAEKTLAGCFRQRALDATIIENKGAYSPHIWDSCLKSARKMLLAALEAQNTGRSQSECQQARQKLSSRMQALNDFVLFPYAPAFD